MASFLLNLVIYILVLIETNILRLCDLFTSMDVDGVLIMFLFDFNVYVRLLLFYNMLFFTEDHFYTFVPSHCKYELYIEREEG